MYENFDGTVWVVLTTITRDDGGNDLEVLDREPVWNWAALNQRVFRSNVNGGDSSEQDWRVCPGRTVEYEWRNAHLDSCQVNRDRASLLDEMSTTLDADHFRVLRGAFREYDCGGDQESELCDCGFIVSQD